MWAITARFVKLVLVCICICSSLPGICKEFDASSIYRSFAQPDISPVGAINNFRVGRLNSGEKFVTVHNATLIVRLLTPLNSSFHKPGDTVQAQVVSSKLENGDQWLPEGTTLEGCIERVSDANYARTNGAIHLSFYYGNAGGHCFEINALPSTSDSAIHPIEEKATTKQKLRNVLMAASFIAVPLAMGSGGTSIAITAGAGALIGGVLADDNKHMKGALHGAWEGSGLGALDPLVAKGRSVVLPTGTAFAMQLRESAQLPSSILRLAKDEQLESFRDSAVLRTQAKIVSVELPDYASIAERCQRLIDQKDLASALGLIDRSLQSAPNDENLHQLQQKLILEVSETELPPRGI